ncbi:hypothetical protein [Aquisediminimonas sediminicola]|uniref:hypothetical protein n=1 Tax=Alteraquisediminimonas sediminicola TaxID=2676787 RepID=UPI001FEBB48F|nr:hypothetical protein [Aquisediminimonas sediminicola]
MTFLKNLRMAGLMLASLAMHQVAFASNNPAMDAQINHLSEDWARIRFRVPDKDQQFTQFDALSHQAAAIAAKYPTYAEPLLWQGIITSEEARTASMFQRMGYATKSRDMLEKARKIDAKAANGGVPMSLGVLYYRVPGFPIGFGNVTKAKAFLLAALAQDPNGLDANYFYGDFLNLQGQTGPAKSYLLKALQAPSDPNRPIWDAGRRAEVRALIGKLGK